MNIFWLDFDVTKCAQYHCDRHVVKIILELAQMLCTAHRVLDGTLVEEEYVTTTDKKRKRKVYVMDNDVQLYKATHVNHPCAIWVRTCDKNYTITYQLFIALCKEYTYRYQKTHKCYELFNITLSKLPDNIPNSKKMTPPALAMPEEYKVKSTIDSYRNYYRLGKKDIATWNKNRETPYWF